MCSFLRNAASHLSGVELSATIHRAEPINVILEVQQHLAKRVRCIAMQATDGMVRGMQAITRADQSPSRGSRHLGA